MTTGNTTKRATVAIGSLSVDGFQMPDGSYRMSQAQTTECIGTTPQNASNFLRSKAFKALQEKESTDQSFETIEVESSQQLRDLEVEGMMTDRPKATSALVMLESFIPRSTCNLMNTLTI